MSLIGKPDTIDTKHFRVSLERGVTVVDVYLKGRIDDARIVYKEFCDKPHLFKTEYPKKFDVFVTAQESKQSLHSWDVRWREWLFDYCFGGEE